MFLGLVIKWKKVCSNIHLKCLDFVKKEEKKRVGKTEIEKENKFFSSLRVAKKLYLNYVIL